MTRRQRIGQPGAPGGLFRGLNLSEEQQEQIKKIMSKALKAASQAETPEAKRQIMQDARKDIIETVLTDEQRKKLKERGKGLRHRWRRGRRPMSMSPEPQQESGTE